MNKLYYHFYIPDKPSHWELLLYEQLDCIEGSLLNQQCEIEICVLSNKENYKKFQTIAKSYPFVQSTWFDSNIKENKNHYEGITLLKLYDECKNYNNIAYIHGKGITNLTKHTNKWRKTLEYAIIENYHDNIKALKNYDVSGIFWTLHHFSGNFWWARSSYIKTLPRPTLENWDLKTYGDKYYKSKNSFLSLINDKYSRHRYELWIGINNPKVNEIYVSKSIKIGPPHGLYGYDLSVKRKTILNFPNEKTRLKLASKHL